MTYEKEITMKSRVTSRTHSIETIGKRESLPKHYVKGSVPPSHYPFPDYPSAVCSIIIL